MAWGWADWFSLRTLKFSVLTFCLRDAYLRPGSGGHGQGALRGAASARRGRLGGVATPVTAIFPVAGVPAVPGRVAPYPRITRVLTRGPRSYSGSGSAGDYPRRHRRRAARPTGVCRMSLLPLGGTASHNASR